MIASAGAVSGEKWPPRSDQTATWDGPDILFVGFQEINPLNAVTVVAGGGLDSVKAWNTAIDCALNCKPLPQEYVAAQVCQLSTLTASRYGLSTVVFRPPVHLPLHCGSHMTCAWSRTESSGECTLTSCAAGKAIITIASCACGFLVPSNNGFHQHVDALKRFPFRL